MSNEPCQNTDIEIWRVVPGDFYSPSIHVTQEGGIGINVGGTVIVKSVRDWHALAMAGKCKTCNGHGMIGGFVNAENGYQSDPCPDCAETGRAL